MEEGGLFGGVTDLSIGNGPLGDGDGTCTQEFLTKLQDQAGHK